MAPDHPPRSPSPNPPTVATEAIFAAQPPIFILPTHLTLEQLHETESGLVDHGGRLTYNIFEAGLILGRIGQKKRAALELRSRGIWTEDIAEPLLKRPGKGREPPHKRRKTERPGPVGVEVVDLSTESEDEEDGVRSRHDPSRHLVQTVIKHPPDTVTVLKLEWLDESIAAGKALPPDPDRKSVV